MLIFENIAIALSGLKSNKTRSVLTMLGIIIGISAVIAIMTIGNSMSLALIEQMESFGANKVTLIVSEKDDGTEHEGMSFQSNRRKKQKKDYISDRMLEDIRRKYASRVSGIGFEENVGTGTAKDGSLYAYISVVGKNEDQLELDQIDMLSGRMFSDSDYEKRRKVAVVSDYFVNNIFAGDAKQAVGAETNVVINGKYYTFVIVGVYEYDASENFSTSSEKDTRTDFYIPYETAIALTHNNNGYEMVRVIASNPSDATKLCNELSDYINEKYYANNKDYQIETYTLQAMLEEITKSMATLSIAISLIAGISLLVGGIGVMNIMLVSITERTREIGTRKALGATNGSIRLQFIVESIMLCLIGGIIGILLGIVIGSCGSGAMGYPAIVSPESIIIAVAFSASIGIFFGYYPANKAAKMNPIDALRYE